MQVVGDKRYEGPTTSSQKRKRSNTCSNEKNSTHFIGVSASLQTSLKKQEMWKSSWSTIRSPPKIEVGGVRNLRFLLICRLLTDWLTLLKIPTLVWPFLVHTTSVLVVTDLLTTGQTNGQWVYRDENADVTTILKGNWSFDIRISSCWVWLKNLHHVLRGGYLSTNSRLGQVHQPW